MFSNGPYQVTPHLTSLAIKIEPRPLISEEIDLLFLIILLLQMTLKDNTQDEAEPILILRIMYESDRLHENVTVRQTF